MPSAPLVAAPATDDLVAPRRPGAGAGFLSQAGPLLWVALAIEAAAVAAQAHYGAVGDVSWMITISEKWLDGQTPYVDFIETNPPAAILLYMPAVALARQIGARPEMIVAAYGFAAVGASLALCAAILRRAGMLAQIGPATVVLSLAALTILPGRTFDERDFFVALLALPPLALSAARAAGAPTDWRLALLAGLCAAAMVAVKPPYASIIAAAAVVVAARAGSAALLGALEHYAAAALLAAYAALTVWRFPAYGEEIMPMVVAAYLPVREATAQLLANVAVVLWLGLAALLALVGGPRARAPLVVAPAAGSVGALAAFFLQGKGWLYQAYPALALLLIAFGVAWDAGERSGRRLAVASGAAGATAAGALLLRAPPIDAAAAASLVAAVAFLAAAAGRAPDAREGVARVAETAAAALLAAACVLYSAPINGPDAAFVRAVADLGPHPRLAAIAEGLGIGFPLVRKVGGVWAQRTQGMLMTAGARRLIDENPGDRALAERLAPIIARDRDMLAEDIRRNRPDGVLVSNVGSRFHEWAMSDPALIAALADYRFVTTSGARDWPIDLYVRQDLVGLRQTFAQPDGSERAPD